MFLVNWDIVSLEETSFFELNIKNKINFAKTITRWRLIKHSSPRSNKMPVDQDWPSVWPVARVFHPASVPLPLHQGWVEPGTTPPGKFANAELMKIPNFLHLTPPAIQRQCEALKKFCTEWPKELNTDEKIDHHFPIQITTSDYLHSSPTIRDARARIVTLQVKLSTLHLNSHAKDKLLRLVKERYDPVNDILTIVSERCPLRKQNIDYAIYLLNVLVSESWKTEPWENEKSEADMEKYVWEGSQSQRTLQQLLERMPDKATDLPEVIEQYSVNVTRFHNEGLLRLNE
uniref:EOG090X09BG n=1 Tax=Daphnia magna TaxID=35525 RepID=A0A4Y7MQ87_9CRUS|nr:EOG090X09BG [Daphnia magna]